MRKLILLVVFLGTCCFQQVVISQQSVRGRFLALQNKIQEYSNEKARLIKLHEEGAGDYFVTARGDTIDLRVTPNNATKLRFRNLVKAYNDSIVVFIGQQNALLP